MDVRSPLFKHIALTLIGVLTLDPLLATAAQLAVDGAAGGNTGIGQAKNGVPVVNIATPNGSGLSHNKFTDYNVGSQGLILNNSNQALTKTQLGGYVTGNANLKGGTAKVILNEVTGANSTQLKGYTEVAGRAAAVIVANPHGIACDGCGFINTPRVTLTTGKPIVENGHLQRFDVDGGEIAIEGQGLNAGNVDQFDLITRSARINAELHARELNIVAGRNEVDATTLAATAKADDGSTKPMLAIDSSALGGMYANTIRLVGTEKGVGVKLAGDMAASAGDIQIDANGQLNMARAAASQDIKLTAQRIELEGDTYAGNTATVRAVDTTVVRQSLAAGKQIEAKGGGLDNAGVVEAGVKADGTLVADGKLLLNADRVTNRGQLVSHGTVEADVKTLDNQSGKLVSAGNTTLTAARVDNGNGQIIAQKDLKVTAAVVANQAGEMLAKDRLRIEGGTLDNQAGTLAADAIELSLAGGLDNSQGLIEAGQGLSLASASLRNREGRLRALGSDGESELEVNGLFDNDQGLVEVGNARLELTSASLSNQEGTVRHLGTAGFELALADLGQAGGRFITNGEMTLNAASWTNSSQLQADRLTLNIGQFTQASSGALVSRQDIVATGTDWRNDGLIASDGSLLLQLAGDYSGSGSLQSVGKLVFEAASARFEATADNRAGGAAELRTTGVMSNYGRITAAGSALVEAGRLDNFGTLGSAAGLRVQADTLSNEQGLIFSGADMALRTASLSNRLGDIYSLGALDVARDDAGTALSLLENRSASIESRGNLSIRAERLDNRKDVFEWGLVQTGGRIEVQCYDCSGDHHNVDYIATEQFETRVLADSAASRIHSGADLTLIGGAVNNHYSTLSATGDIRIEATTLENLGAALATVERERRFNTGRITDGTDKRFRAAWIYPYNALTEPQPMPTALEEWNLVSDVQRETPIGIAAPAIIQAGGNVHIQASQPLENQAVLAHQAPQGGSGQALDTSVGSTSDPLVVRLNPQLPADTAQQAVDPLGLPGFSLPGGEHGLFQVSTNPGHHYLVETNPAFADLGQFVSSDYMLGLLGFDPDQAQRRLGDGLYEQRLIEQAVAARTGKRLLDGFSSDEAQFRYLMDNAVASKQALNLTLGVGLSAEQVAALTHDIVWLEEREVNGQRVLAPMLYLAQASDRLAPSGALVQGQNVTLIGGSSLSNSGTLRASVNLDASATNIANTGLIQANERLQLLATQSIHNAQAGIINGKDVSAVAVEGDIVNQRNVSQQTLSGNGYAQTTSVVAKAAAIEAGNDLRLQAGGDLLNVGATLSAGGNAEFKAGGDLLITSAVEEQGSLRQDKRHFWSSTQTVQHGSDVNVGGNLVASAAQNLAVIASQVKAGGDVTLGAGKDMTIAAATNEDSSEYRYKRSGKKVEQQDSTLRQQAAVIEAGGNLGMLADGNMLVMASQLKAGGEAYLYAGDQLALLAGQDSDYHLYDMKKKGSWGSKQTRRDEVTRVRVVGSQISTGGDLILASGGDQRYQRANLQSGGDLLLDSGGAITFEAVKDLDQESHEKSKSSVVWNSAKGKGNTDETLLQSQLGARGEVIVKAVDGLAIDLKEVNQQSVGQTIDAMVEADPSLAWLKDMEQRGDVDWRRVKEVHDSFKYSQSGLGGAAAMVIAIVVAYFTAGAASGLVAGAAGAGGATAGATAGAAAAGTAAGTAAAGTAAATTSVWAAATATTAAGWANVAATAMISSAAGGAAVSTINNKGNLELVLKDITSSDAVRGYLVTGITAGLTAGVYDSWAGTETGTPGVVPDSAPVTTAGGLSSLEGIGRFAGNQLLQNGTSTLLDRALGGDSTLGDALRSSLANSFAAAGFNLIGDVSGADRWDIKDGSLAKTAMHAVMGGLAAEAAGGDFRTGALAAGVNEALVDTLAKQYAGMDEDKRKGLLVMNSQVIGVLAAASQGDDQKNLETGAWVAGNSTQYNYLTHQKVDEVKACLAGDTCSTQAQKDNAVKEAEALSKWLDSEMTAMCSLAPTSDACRTAMNAAIKYVAMQDAWDYMNSDVGRSSGSTFDQLYNADNAKDSFGLYLNTIDNRADFFGASNQYEQHLGSQAQWYGGAELVSRAMGTGLGADGHGSSLTFLLGAVTLTGWNAKQIYDWRTAAGNALIEAGFDNFKTLYNDGADPVKWDINQLKNEQRVLQTVHEAYLGDRSLFTYMSRQVTDSDSSLVKTTLQDYQTMPGGIDILNYESRIKYGCKLLGYSVAQGCVP